MPVALASRIVGLLLVATGTVMAQSVTLQIKPRMGDTLRMRLDQQSEMTGVKKTATGEASAHVINTMRMFSRAIVEASSDRGSTVLAVTDSVIFTTTDEHARAAAQQAQNELRGQRTRFRVAPDGSVGVNETSSAASREIAQVVSLMPAAFPKSAISVGESWIREMALPTGSQFGAQVSGKLHVTFRFDSLTHGGEWAFVSMRGEMKPSAGTGTATGSTLEKGYVSGWMLVDKRRGWLTESSFSIVMSSLVTPPLMTGVAATHVTIRISQHMQTERRER